MGYIEAKEDGIKIVSKDKPKQYTIYFPKCYKCGVEIKSMRYDRGVQYTCKECKLKTYLSDKEIKKEFSKEVKESKFNNAVKRITKKVGTNISKYEKAIHIVHKNLFKEHWFESTEEIMTAIELLKNNIKTRHQVKVETYRVDFVLEDEKIILEIDGRIFHTESTKAKEQIRDNIILMKFGLDWEVIRITDEYINQNIKRLVPAIRKIKEERKRVRANFDGTLPDWYSNRYY